MGSARSGLDVLALFFGAWEVLRSTAPNLVASDTKATPTAKPSSKRTASPFAPVGLGLDPSASNGFNLGLTMVYGFRVLHEVFGVGFAASFLDTSGLVVAEVSPSQ